MQIKSKYFKIFIKLKQLTRTILPLQLCLQYCRNMPSYKSHYDPYYSIRKRASSHIKVWRHWQSAEEWPNSFVSTLHENFAE